MYTYTIGHSPWQQIEDTTVSMSFLIWVFLLCCFMGSYHLNFVQSGIGSAIQQLDWPGCLAGTEGNPRTAIEACCHSWNGIANLCHCRGSVCRHRHRARRSANRQASTVAKKHAARSNNPYNCQPHTPVMISSLLKQSTPGWDHRWPEELQKTSDHQAWQEPAPERNHNVNR